MAETGRSKQDRAVGRVAVVTGGGQGIGRAYALRLAREGASVVVADILPDAASEVVHRILEEGGNAVALSTDVANAESVQQMVASAIAVFGAIHILVNNAGGTMYPRTPFDEIDEDQWDHVVDVNLKGQWLCARACASPMKEAGWGRMVNISSSGIYRGGQVGTLPYVAAKAGVVGLTRALARELAPHYITVNAIAPGYVPVPNKRIFDEAGLKEMAPRLIDEQVIKRHGTAEDLSNLMAFIVSDEAAWITGQVINVDGGWNFH